MPYDRHGTGYALTDTSAAAAAAIPAEGKRQLQDRVLAVMRKARVPLCADEIAKRLDRDKLSIRPRMTELRNLGLIEDSGERQPTSSGRMSIAWKLTEKTQ